ncbi:MAG: Gfo/Idh/MocA family protein [Planctomycetota bacterium]
MRFVFSLALAIGLFCLSSMSYAQSHIRVGVIGLDTSHAGAFSKIMREAPANSPMARLKIVAAFPGGSPDIPSSIDRVPNYTKEFEAQGIQIVDSIDALLEKVDAVMLNSLDGRKHLDQAYQVFKSGKRVFIDKPLAADLTDAIAIAKLAEHYKTPWFTSSSLRFTPTIYRYREKSDRKILGAQAWSPCSLEPHHTDLTWYGIHGVEALFTAMGVGCEEVTRTKTEGTDVVVGRWKDGRVGVFRGIRTGTQGYGLTVFGSDFLENDAKYEGYEPLVVEIAKFFAGGEPPVSSQESLEIMAFIQAAQQSSDSKGVPVSVQSVVEKATEQALKKIQPMIR